MRQTQPHRQIAMQKLIKPIERTFFMAKQKNTGLGRGLDAIFADNFGADEKNHISVLRISEIEPNPNQPRKNFDSESLSELASSIAAHGLIQPIVVRPSKSEGYFEIVAGERRWRAAKMAGLSEVPVIEMELDDRKAAQIALIENVQRENLNAIEEAEAYQSLITDYDMKQDELALRIGKSRSAIANAMRLLDLPDEVISLIQSGKLSAGHARTLLGLKDPEKIFPTAQLIINKLLSVRETEKLVKQLNNSEKNSQDSEKADSGDLKVDYIAELAGKITSRLGRRVSIKNTGKSKKLEISFIDDDDLDELIKLLCGDNIFDD